MKKGKSITHHLWAKALVFILFLMSAACLALSVLASVFMVAEDVYLTPRETFKYEAFSSHARSDIYSLAEYAEQGDVNGFEQYVKSRNIAYAAVKKQSDGSVVAEYGTQTENSGDYVFEEVCICESEEGGAGQSFTVTIVLSDRFEVNDYYYASNKVIDLICDFRLWIPLICLISLISAILCFVFLMCSSGRRYGEENICMGWGTRIPFDLLTASATLLCIFVSLFLFEIGCVFDDFLAVVLVGAALVIDLAIFTAWCMSFALRIKLGKWWKNTLVYKILALAVRFFKVIPSVWRTVIIFGGISAAEAFFIIVNAWEPDNILIFWFLEKIVLFAVAVALAVMLKRLLKGGQALSAGDFNYRIDTCGMTGNIKKHGENLNSIGEGMNIAVEERMKSERMKTELITNVSHDIKTPLTSIINYADIISREPCDNEKITEYATVLLRQSERLKRLIEDLMEVSKASSGTLEIELEPFDAGVMVSQAVGEYQTRFAEKGLAAMLSGADLELKIMADGRRLWRVFDNLLNNICKYALESTRVYVSLEETDGNAVITFKNTSKEPLGFSGEELKERFTRGDASRNTEGNGLGLAIAESLTELQGGKLDVVIDGDLFKAILTFPKVTSLLDKDIGKGI